MHVIDALRFIIKKSGLTVDDASIFVGRSKSYFSSSFSRGSVPKADTMADLCDRLGWDLLMRDRSDGFEVYIDPKQ